VRAGKVTNAAVRDSLHLAETGAAAP